MSVVDLLGPDGRGPLWGTASDDLNATLLAWPSGEGTPEHVNDSCDVLVVVLAGEGVIELDGETLPLATGTCALVEKGRRRRIAAGAPGIRYLTVHLRRGGLQLGRFERPSAGTASGMTDQAPPDRDDVGLDEPEGDEPPAEGEEEEPAPADR